MQPNPAIINALERFARRAVVAAFVRNVIGASVVAVIVAQVLWLAGFHSAVVFVTLAAATTIVSAAIALREKPALVDVARRVDQTARLQDLLVSALTAQGGGLAELVRRDAVTALRTQMPSVAYPVTLPGRWRQFGSAALVAQAILLGVIWQAPARRAGESTLTSLTLPSSSAPAGQARPQPATGTQSRSTQNPPTAPATATAPTTPGRTALAQDESTGLAAAAISTETGRLRLATANAESDITAGRVPASRRAMVERYFAALQSQRKTPR